MGLFQKKCEHDWEVMEVSNVYYEMPDKRLCRCKCKKCGEEQERWAITMLKNRPIFEKLAEIQWAKIVKGSSKVVINTPARCTDCKLMFTDSRLKCHCILGGFVPETGERPDWCPLQDENEEVDSNDL